MWSRHEYAVVTMLVVSSENLVATSFFLFPGIGVATSIQCHDITLSTFTAYLCRDLDSMSRPHFCCLPLCFLVTAPLFMLRHHSIVLSLQKSRDSTLLVCLFSCRDMAIRSRPSSFFNQCNSCRDLKSMSRPNCSSSLLKYLSRTQFHVATSFLLPAILILVATTFFGPFNKFYVTTSVPCHNLAVLLSIAFCIATSI